MENRFEIIPAVIPKSFEELSEKLALVKSFAPTVHIDANDGVFTREPSWPYGGTDEEVFTAITEEKDGLPFWDSLDYEAHLMVAKPEEKVAAWVQAGAMRIIVHVEAIHDFDALWSTVGELTELVLALKLQTPLETLEPFAERIEGIHLMTILQIGYQGVGFDETSLDRVKAAHAQYPNLPISVDGGITTENAKALFDAGASRLVVGSAIVGSEDPEYTYRELENIARLAEGFTG